MLCHQNALACSAHIKVFKLVGTHGSPRESGIAGCDKQLAKVLSIGIDKLANDDLPLINVTHHGQRSRGERTQPPSAAICLWGFPAKHWTALLGMSPHREPGRFSQPLSGLDGSPHTSKTLTPGTVGAAERKYADGCKTHQSQKSGDQPWEIPTLPLNRRNVLMRAHASLSANSERFDQMNDAGFRRIRNRPKGRLGRFDHAWGSILLILRSHPCRGSHQGSKGRSHCQAKPTDRIRPDTSFRIMYIMFKLLRGWLARLLPSPRLLLWHGA